MVSVITIMMMIFMVMLICDGGGGDAGVTTMMLTAINKCNWLQLEIVGRRFMVECKLKTS